MWQTMFALSTLAFLLLTVHGAFGSPEYCGRNREPGTPFCGFAVLPGQQLSHRPLAGRGAAIGFPCCHLPRHSALCLPMSTLDGGGEEDWREVRAKFVAQEQILGADNAEVGEDSLARSRWLADEVGSEAPIWAHEIGAPEQGCLLVASQTHFGKAGRLAAVQSFTEAVVLLVEHGPGGSAGLILNRQTPYTLGSVTSRLPGFEESPLYLGGDVGEGVQVLHGVPELTGSRRVLDGLFMGIDPWHARELLDAGARSPRDFRFFFRYARWGPTQLEAEVQRGLWHLAACPAQLVLRHELRVSRKPLWREVMELMGGKYALIARSAYDEL